MNMTKEISFTIEKAAGTLKLVYTPFSQKLYQDSVELKRVGSLGGDKFKISNIDGTTQNIRVLNNFVYGRIVKTNSGKIMLEEKLSISNIIIAFLPILIVMTVGSIFIMFINGAVGGALIGVLSVLGLIINTSIIRQEASFSQKLILMTIISVFIYFVYILAGLLSITVYNALS